MGLEGGHSRGNHHHSHGKICQDYWVEVMVNEGGGSFGRWR